MAMSRVAFEAHRENERVTSNNAPAIQQASVATRFAELHASLADRRKRIEKTSARLADQTREMGRLCAAEKKEAGNLAELRAQRDAAGLNYARDEHADPDRHDSFLAKNDRETNRTSSKIAGLQKLIAEANGEVATSSAALTALNREQAEYEHYLAAQAEKKELDSLVQRGQAAIEAQAKAIAELAEITQFLRTRNYLAEANRAFGVLSAGELERRFVGYRN